MKMFYGDFFKHYDKERAEEYDLKIWEVEWIDVPLQFDDSTECGVCVC